MLSYQSIGWPSIANTAPSICNEPIAYGKVTKLPNFSRSILNGKWIHVLINQDVLNATQLKAVVLFLGTYH